MENKQQKGTFIYCEDEGSLKLVKEDGSYFKSICLKFKGCDKSSLEGRSRQNIKSAALFCEYDEESKATGFFSLASAEIEDVG